MIRIMQIGTGSVIHQVEGDSLIEADLSGAGLSDAFLSEAVLHGANLSKATLSGANLKWADLSGANLSRAALNEANLNGADLSGADLTDAVFVGTIIVSCPTLHLAIGLDKINHLGPSFLDARTLRASVPHLPDVFLQGVGYSQEEIAALRELYSRAIEFFSCFLSHTDKDADFVDRLRADLLSNNVSCWHYRYDMRTGGYWREQINTAIKVYDKLVLICSEHSLTRKGVVEEIIEAMEYQDKPDEKNRLKLFPVRLDDFIFSEAMAQFAKQQVAKGEWGRNWLDKVKAIQMADFRGWKDHDAYKREFDKLLRDLKNPAKR